MTQNPPTEFIIKNSPNGISSIKRKNDLYGTEFIRPGTELGVLEVEYRSSGNWKTYSKSKDNELSVGSQFIQHPDRLECQITHI